MNENPFQYRNLGVQVLLTVVTVGFYPIYWYYVTTQEMVTYLKREEPVFLWTVLWIVPILSFYSYYKQGEIFEQISPDINRWITLLLWVLFPPAVWIIIQMKLNKMANAGSGLVA